MEKLYDRADIYDTLENDPARYAFTQKHWETILEGKSIQTLLDVSIGSGNMTLPLLDFGIILSGSDLSENMLQKCREKAAAKGRSMDLRVSDFRELNRNLSGQYDCVASTGNSLPYVANQEVLSVLEQMDSLVRPGGYLYFDVRNWDRILQKEVFQEHYYPISRKLLLDKLEKLGYESPEIYRMPAHTGVFDEDKHDWYAVIARKPA